ncbi:unnamed protein product [Candida verbasci]|uniref:Uncharacterized protein n=1 Tax=Candida verbasci TaxID=1227364 RepID=A0A9W4XA24_9ASCO|nr:unnamed protein product [Candida verbasci]
MSSDDETQELLVVTASTASEHIANSSETIDEVHQLSKQQEFNTSTIFGKLKQFIRLQLGYKNEFEQFILNNEPNDCSLVAKYCKTTTINLTHQPTLSRNQITLNTLHIPHPLVNFMKNELPPDLSTEDQLNIKKELEESPILVFIHGLGGQMSQFEPLMGLLSQCSEIISLDLPGFGNSKLNFKKGYKIVSEISNADKERISSSVAKMTYDDFKTDNIVSIIFEFIQQNIPENKKVVIIGHSMGTILSIKTARKLPAHKVEGLVLLSPPDIIDDTIEGIITSQQKTVAMLKIFTYIPWLFNTFRIWDRLEGLASASVKRQLSNETSFYNKLRQFRWNMDVESIITLKYVNGFQKCKISELIEAINKLNDNPKDKHVYEKTLLICGTNDHLTPIKGIHKIDNLLTSKFNKKVSSIIEVKNVGHSLLLSKPEFISGMILNHFESKYPERLHLSPAWVLKIKAQISGDKWGLKNELKWLNIKPISSNIINPRTNEIAPLLGMKTLREGDPTHSPNIVESLFYGDVGTIPDIKGNLIAIIDISADIPPYTPKSFKQITYYKCATVSKVVPDQTAIRRFIQLVNDILSNNSIEKSLIGVHCHYGFNRTGFLICCYLIEVLGWKVHEAIEAFKAAKAPGIKHPHFIDALYVRYEK